MTVHLEPHQLAFYQELFSPFPDSLLSTTKRGGKELTYVDKRAISNRLDSVCGPSGWYPEYTETKNGLMCHLSISCPMANPGVWVVITKTDGAGPEEMGSYKKVWDEAQKKMVNTDEFETEVDNNEKSAFTNAFRRAAQDAWGIGRYLYGKGVPGFLDLDGGPVEESYRSETTGPKVKAPVQPTPAPAALSGLPSVYGASERLASAKAAATPTPTVALNHGNFIIPPAGKVWGWAQEMGKTFDTSIVSGMADFGESKGWGRKFIDWNTEQARACALDAIRHLRQMPTYKGQFEYLFDGPGAEPVQPHEPTNGTPATIKPGVNMADLRKEILLKIDALVMKQTGSAPTIAQKKEAFETIASVAANASGNTGEIPESLKGCTDPIWLAHMILVLDDQIQQAVKVEVDGDCPF